MLQRRFRAWLGSAAFGVVLAAASNTLAVTITFDQAPADNAGTLSYNGSGGALVGTNIVFETVAGTSTPLNNGVTLYCVGGPCHLNFVTGLNSLEPAGTPGNGSSWQWLGGGSIAMTGTLNTAANGSGTTVASGTILSGSWDNPVTGILSGDTPTNHTNRTLEIVGGGPDTKNPGLLAFYGIPSIMFQFSSTDISAKNPTINNTTKGFTASLVNGNADLVNNATIVPEPGSLLLLGSGLIGVAAWRRRRRTENR